MYVILVNNDNTLIATQKNRIMQRSKLADSLQFLVPQFYEEQDMSEYTVLLEYLLPCSRKYCTEILELTTGMHNDHLRYILPFDTKLTSEPGKIEVQLTFAKTDLDEYGVGIQRVRKTSATTIEIIPIAAWSDIIPDSALSALDQRLIKADAQIRALEELGNIFDQTKADNIKYDKQTNELQLLAGDRAIGDIVTIDADSDGCDCDDDGGIKVVLF